MNSQTFVNNKHALEVELLPNELSVEIKYNAPIIIENKQFVSLNTHYTLFLNQYLVLDLATFYNFLNLSCPISLFLELPLVQVFIFLKQITKKSYQTVQ